VIIPIAKEGIELLLEIALQAAKAAGMSMEDINSRAKAMGLKIAADLEADRAEDEAAHAKASGQLGQG